MATICNVVRAKDAPALQPHDIMPWLRPKPEPAAQPERRQTPEEMRALMEQITRDMGGIVRPRNQPLA